MIDKKLILKKLRNELVREITEETKLVTFKESNHGEAVVLVKDIIRAVDTLIYSEEEVQNER